MIRGTSRAQVSYQLLEPMTALHRLLSRIDGRMARVFAPWALRHPRHLAVFLRLARAHERASRLRAEALARGLRVPPFLVLSVTSRCNLRCAGCFAGAVGTTSPSPAAFTLRDWCNVVEQSAALGVIGFVIAGGEPFLLPDLPALFARFSDRLFLVFTNGAALRDREIEALRTCRNTAVIVSLEGDRGLTDARRGPGVFDLALRSLDRLRDAGVLTGLAVTIGPANVEYWSEPHNIDALIARSGPLAFFLEQIPAGDCHAAPALADAQRARFRRTVLDYRNRETRAAYIIHSPADEEALGGCVSAGRGFAHIGPAGDVTACPVSPLATHNLRTSTLAEAFSSPLFTLIRDNGRLLETDGHPCALFAHAAELEALARPLGAYRTGGSSSS